MRRFLFLVFFIYSAQSSLAPFIKKCKGGDNKCIKEATQIALPILALGLKEHGIDPLDPLFIRNLDASTKGLTLKFQDIVGTGLKDCVVKKMKHDVSKSKLKSKLQCSIDARGQYEMKGKLLFLPVEGKGPGRVVIKNFIITVESDLNEIKGSDGLKHWTVKNHKYSYELKDKPTFDLENLFNGNEVLGRAVHDFINENSDELIKEFGVPIFKTFLEKIIENVENFFKLVPLRDLTLDATE